MKRIVGVLSVIAVLSLVFPVTGRLAAQDESEIQARSQIKVKAAQVVSGVVVVDILKGARKAELQCNDGQPTCNTLKAGGYWMVVLPKNFGMYDCQNVEIYRGDKNPAEKENLDAADRIGAYCLIEN